MGKRFLGFVLALCLMLSGCSWMDGDYVSITHHKNDQSAGQDVAEGISEYTELLAAIFQMVENGTERSVLSVGNYERESLEQDMRRAVRYIQDQTPLGNYAVEKITYEIGASVGLTGVALEIVYRHGRGEIRQIRECFTMDSAKELIRTALRGCSSGLVIEVLDYEETDIAQFVQDFVNDNPSQVMEAPQVIANTYPEVGKERILEIQFFYETSRDQLKTMQSYVQSVFAAARLYVLGETGQSLKYAQLFTFLMNRYDYKLETALTPAYSLLRHGVGDSKAFATVYAEMCRNSGLHGFLVAGTRDGEKHYWNIVSIEGQFYHVDLLSSKEAGELQMRTTEQMDRYVWDYSFYPDCTLKEPPPEESTEPAPTEESTEPVPTEEGTEPAPTEEGTEPAPTEESTEPVPTEESTEPAPAEEPAAE